MLLLYWSVCLVPTTTHHNKSIDMHCVCSHLKAILIFFQTILFAIVQSAIIWFSSSSFSALLLSPPAQEFRDEECCKSDRGRTKRDRWRQNRGIYRMSWIGSFYYVIHAIWCQTTWMIQHKEVCHCFWARIYCRSYHLLHTHTRACTLTHFADIFLDLSYIRWIFAKRNTLLERLLANILDAQLLLDAESTQ